VYDQSTGTPINTPKSYGKSIKAADLPDGIAKFFPVHSSSSSSQPQGLPADLLLKILRYIRDEIAEIRTAFARVEMRMVGGSLLIVYEGSTDKARAALDHFVDTAGGHADAMDEDEEDEDAEGEDDDEVEVDESVAKKPGPPFAVKLIDFAHTKLVPGEGPDEGILKGIDTTLSLLDGRIKQVEAL
jgi:inositol-polyphosphate multikinase